MTIYLALRRPGGRRKPPKGYDVAIGVKQPTRGRAGHPCPPIRPCSRWGLAAAASPPTAGRSYRPISPLPPVPAFARVSPCHILSSNWRRYVSVPLSVFRQSRKPGSYPAPCPVEPGLSSLPRARSPGPARRRSPGPADSPPATLAQGTERVKEI